MNIVSCMTERGHLQRLFSPPLLPAQVNKKVRNLRPLLPTTGGGCSRSGPSLLSDPVQADRGSHRLTQRILGGRWLASMAAGAAGATGVHSQSQKGSLPSLT